MKYYHSVFFIILFFIILLFSSFSYKSEELIGGWKLTHYDAFETVKEHDSYQNASQEIQELYDKTVERLLDSVTYEFGEDYTLNYVDMENQKLTN